MKKLLLLSVFALITSALLAQDYKGLGDQKIQIGFNFYGYGSGIKATYDYGLNDRFSVGLGANFFNTGNYTSGFFIFGRGDYHLGHILDAPDELDLYLGAELGLIGNRFFGISGHFGAQYHLTKNLGVFVEIGSNGALGISIHL